VADVLFVSSFNIILENLERIVAMGRGPDVEEDMQRIYVRVYKISSRLTLPCLLLCLACDCSTS